MVDWRVDKLDITYMYKEMLGLPSSNIQVCWNIYILPGHGQEKKVSGIIQDFNKDWKKSLDSINSEILSSFPNLKLGTSLLQQALTSLVQYYHRLGFPSRKIKIF